MLLDKGLVWKDMNFEGGQFKSQSLLIFCIYANIGFVFVANISLETGKIPKRRGKSVSSNGPHAISAE